MKSSDMVAADEMNKGHNGEFEDERIWASK
jgi:hypothetical protein